MTKAPRQRPRLTRQRHYIAEWRTHRALSQEQLAERIERSRGLISQLESFTTKYTEETLEALAHALNCEPWDLLHVNPLKEGQVIDMMDLLREATPEQRAQAIGFVQGLVRRQ